MAVFIWANIAAFNLEGLGGLLGYSSLRHGPVATSLTTRALGDDGDRADHPAIADALRTDFRLEPGAQVAFIGYSYSAYWARLARLRIIAELRPEEFEQFWSASAAARDEVLAAFAEAGAEAMLSEPPGAHVATGGWDEVADTGYLVRRFRQR